MTNTYIPVTIRRKVLTRDGFTVWCGKKEEHDVSHFIQKRCGGGTFEHNLVTTCKICRQKRHYDRPSEFISKLTLEKLEVFRNSTMKIKVIRPTGEEIEGEVEDLPAPNVKAFYLKHPGNGTREIIFVEPGMRILELGKGNLPGRALREKSRPRTPASVQRSSALTRLRFYAIVYVEVR